MIEIGLCLLVHKKKKKKKKERKKDYAFWFV